MKRTKQIVILLMSAMLTTISCKKEEVTPEPKVDQPTCPESETEELSANSLSSFTGIIDGVSYSYIEGEKNISAGVGKTSIGMAASFDASLGNDDAEKSVFSIDKGETNIFLTNEEFKDFFKAGSYTYGSSGFTIKWYDDSDTEWTNYLGAADQTNSTIKIEDAKEINVFGNYYITTKITLACNLYDADGNSKKLTNGVFIGSFENI